MRARSRKEAIFLAICILLSATLACNLPTPREAATHTPEVATVIVTASTSQSTEEPSEEPASPTGTSETPESGNSSGDEESDPSILIDSDVFTSVDVKNGDISHEGQISFPGSDASDEIYVKPVGFDSTVSSGNLIFSLSCSGEGKAKVNYKGGAVKSGSPGCGETWTVAVVTGSADSHITIRLDDSGEVNWTLSVTSGE
jgi:hypothetical protein